MTEIRSRNGRGDSASKGALPAESRGCEQCAGGDPDDERAGATVCVIDDEAPIRKALARLLRSTGYVVQTFASGGAFLSRSRGPRPSCIVLDLQMPDLNGLDLQERLSADGDRPPVVFLTGRGDIPASVQAMKLGAADFLTKPVDERVLLTTIERAISSDDAAREERQEAEMIGERLANLTPREHEVLRHVIAGRLNKQVADRLNISEKTVKVHRGRMMEKLGAQSVAELVRLSARIGVEPA